MEESIWDLSLEFTFSIIWDPLDTGSNIFYSLQVCNFLTFFFRLQPPNHTALVEILHEGWFKGRNYEMGI